MKAKPLDESRKLIVLRNPLILMVFAIYLAVSCQSPAMAKLDGRLVDRYLETNFSWAIFLEPREVKHYLTYEGSLLQPLTKVRVYYRVFPEDSKVYEDIWYSNGKLIGLRRRGKLEIDTNEPGIIVVGDTHLQGGHTRALASAIAMLAIRLQFKQIVTSVVQVPIELYENIIVGLADYNFSVKQEVPTYGPQMSIHLRSYPGNRDETLYLN